VDTRTNADIEFDEMEAALIERGISEDAQWNRFKTEGVNTTGCNWRKSCLRVMRDMISETETAPAPTRTGCRHPECDNRGRCYDCGAYVASEDAGSFI
jgi:hypothetical protein